jgi:DNA (cytosine-5)-methyltransferase 1
VRKDLEEGPFDLSIPKRKKTSVYDILDTEVAEKYYISDYEKMVLNVWDTFIKGVKEEIIGFPIWFDYLNEDDLKALGFPVWKMQFVQKNQNLYKNNKAFIDQWRLDFDAELSQFKPTDRKFEWQMGKGYKSIYEGIIQFRPSGVRVKKPDFLPALVAMVHTPIIGRDLRRITPRECAKLQSFPEDFILSRNEKQAYKQFGNAVNVDVIKYVFEHTVLNSIKKT